MLFILDLGRLGRLSGYTQFLIFNKREADCSWSIRVLVDYLVGPTVYYESDPLQKCLGVLVEPRTMAHSWADHSHAPGPPFFTPSLGGTPFPQRSPVATG